MKGRFCIGVFTVVFVGLEVSIAEEELISLKDAKIVVESQDESKMQVGYPLVCRILSFDNYITFYLLVNVLLHQLH